MSIVEFPGWNRLRHGGLLLDTPRLKTISSSLPEPLSEYKENELRRRLTGEKNVSDFVKYVLEMHCGFTGANGEWKRGSGVGSDWARQTITEGTVKPQHIWRGDRGGMLPVFIDSESRIGIGRGRKSVNRVLQWLRGGNTEKLAVLTNGQQWRLIFAGLDFDAWCEWDTELWMEEGAISDQVQALRTLISPTLWEKPAEGGSPRLLEAVLDTRKGQAELSTVLGERVRNAVEILVQAHGEALAEQCQNVDKTEIYRAAVRIVMRMVVVLFAESRDLLPRDNPIYHGSYGLTGLLEELEKQNARGSNRLARSMNAWPRVVALFNLIYSGSHHPELSVPAYGGDLFRGGDDKSSDGLLLALHVFENACFDQSRNIVSDKAVFSMLERITRTKIKVRQGRSSTWVPSPVDFSDMSSEYIGILYEGLLDFELKTASSNDPIIFLSVGNQPALPLSRLEDMDNDAIADLLKNMKKSNDTDDGEEVEEEVENEQEIEGTDTDDAVEADESESQASDESAGNDERHIVRTRSETWARRAVEAGKLVTRPRGKLTPEKQAAFEEEISRKAKQLVIRIVLPNEWYLVRWGGTRKGSGSFYTRPGLAVPTVRRTLHPLAYNPPGGGDGNPDVNAPSIEWLPKLPEEILSLKICDPACGSGTFPVTALRYLTDALFASLYSHNRIKPDGEKAILNLLGELSVEEGDIGKELLPYRPDDELFESKLKAILRRHVVERCIYGVDIDPLAVELCRLSLWIETMDRDLPFSFLDHKIKCGNGLVGAWFDTFQHYPVMAWKNRGGGDVGHNNGVHYEKEERTNEIKAFVKDVLKPDLRTFLSGDTLFSKSMYEQVAEVHKNALDILMQLHSMSIRDNEGRARIYRENLIGSPTYRSLKTVMDLWCACWFWPVDELEHAPLPTSLAQPSDETLKVLERIVSQKRFFHWELEFPDVFNTEGGGFDAILGNPPWNVAKPISKEFFSNIDPLYRSYGKQEAIRHQTRYFENVEVESSWLDYNSGFKDQSNLMSHARAPFGDPMLTDESSDRFIIFGNRSNSNKNLLAHDNWRMARSSMKGFADELHPFRHQGSADINLYKTFLELGHALLRSGGRLGFIVPSGIYSDHGTGDLRNLFLNNCKWEWLFGFENREGIFDIHRSFKFNPIIVEKGGETEAIRTAFMRRKLDDWERAEESATFYSREQIVRFSPGTLGIVEINSTQELRLLEKIYENNITCFGMSENSWGIQYGREFHMTDDSKLFLPVKYWTSKGYSQTIYGDMWETPDRFIALPFYEGRMISSFDYCAKAWVSGKGREAEWVNIEYNDKKYGPQYLMDIEIAQTSGKSKLGPKLGIVKVSSSTNTRSMKCAFIPGYPCGESVYTMQVSPNEIKRLLALEAIFSSFVFDYFLRVRFVGVNISSYILGQCPIPKPTLLQKGYFTLLVQIAARLSFISASFSKFALLLDAETNSTVRVPPKSILTAHTNHERLRLRCIVDSIVACIYGVDKIDITLVLKDCSYPFAFTTSDDASYRFNPKGFWRVDKGKDPELRHTVLALVAFHDLEKKIEECAGDRDKGIEAFLNQNDGEGWMIPETLRLADYGLGHDDRAQEHQPVASRLGPKFFDWQLAQSAEESWRECHLHARNMLGAQGYARLLLDIENEKNGVPPPQENSNDELGDDEQLVLFE